MSETKPGVLVRLAVAGSGAAILFSLISLSPAIIGLGGKFASLLPIALYQATWCFFEGWVVQTHRPLTAHPGSRDQPGMLPLTTGLAALVIATLAVRETMVAAPPAPAIIGFGLIVGAAGIMLRQIAIAQLGSYFRDAIDLCDDHRQVTSGLYRIVRHPAETGFLLGMGGLVIISGSLPAAVAFGVILLPLSIARMILESRLMRERFGV